MALLSKRQNGGSALTDLFSMDRFFDDDWLSLKSSANVPSANVKENEKSFDIEMATPGLSKKDIDVSVDNNILTISAEKEDEKQDENENYTRREFNYNAFSRSFSLPDSVEANKVKADYQEGVLHINIPKKEEAQQKSKKKIEVE